MVEALQMFLFLFKSKYRRKCAWFSPFLCSVLIVLLFCHGALTGCSNDNSCINGVCNNDTCICLDGWQGPECQYCGGKVNLTATSGFITDGPFNYSVSTQCTWVLLPPRVGPNQPTIRVRLESFATECGWDHLYVYDGDSVKAERLLAVYSGVMDPEDSGWTRQVIARSGSVLLHFFSDDAYAMEGFNITYAAYSCPSNDHRTNCSNHGECDNGTCTCEQGWTGVACDELICPDDCNAAYGAGSCTPNGCVCTATRSGDDCSLSTKSARWEWAWREAGEGGSGEAAPAVAGAQLVEYRGELVRVGGEAFADAPMLYTYSFDNRKWQVLTTHGPQPISRSSHSAILYKDEIIMFGGVLHTGLSMHEGLAGLEGRAGEVTNEVWRINLDSIHPAWYNSTPPSCPPAIHHNKRCGGLAVSGHTAVLVEMGPTKQPVMLVFFGHSPHYGYMHIVQEYYIEESTWWVVGTRGWSARAGFAHSAAYDALSHRVYVHGGLVSESEAAQAPSSALFEYDIEERVWRPLPSAPTPRYLHAAVFVSPGIMVVLGGNAHNDSAAHAAVAPHSASCYCSLPYTYDVRCQKWRALPAPRGSARAAHAAVLTSKGALFYGGFDGRLRSDALLFMRGADCSENKDELSCVSSAERAAVACGWSPHQQLCLPLEKVGWKESLEGAVKTCETEPVSDESLCNSAEWCGACVAANCAWCGACFPRAEHCARRRHSHIHTATTIEECGASAEGREVCARYHSCAACHAHHHYNSNEEQRLCYWDYELAKCRPANSSEDLRSSASASAACSAPCSTFKTCSNCTAEECIWCASADSCVDKNAYGASFPLGGCRVWATAASGACAGGGGCAAHGACGACLREPACGWCDDGAPGGRGACLRGGHGAPAERACPAERWHFTRCPPCQCNGHAVCDARHRCLQPCAGRAAGPRCERCAHMHWGSPLNGRSCEPCECNAQAVACAPDTGRCFCSTKGLAGDKCDKCDNTNHYHADVYNKGACYYDLAVDYQFTFNLSKKEDRHLTAINFRNAPVKPDVDADFSITCSSHARMNLTVRTRTEPTERSLFTDVNCTNFRYKFTKADHQFGVEDNVTLTTFFVYVYDFKPPLWIQISFSQYPKLNLQQFFITFSSCFLLLLLLAAALWKIKQKYDMYRRRQRLFVEMEQMASRPFSQVSIELERFNTPGGGGGGGGVGVPAPVALEPCAGGRAAVLSLLVRLPRDGGRAPPHGGLAAASALVTLGHAPPHHAKRTIHVRTSVDYTRRRAVAAGAPAAGRGPRAAARRARRRLRARHARPRAAAPRQADHTRAY